eukprot:TRINITY_DN3036_c0_g1_i1.p3 TRINITY_DN3036_c0_g1~~TRINITY_DN3036_c0_g1_i1.p3  ORF type:complete len:122 (+),score=30.98 TRINITY_DN3036_c0_g1_i1:527-892(+)
MLFLLPTSAQPQKGQMTKTNAHLIDNNPENASPVPEGRAIYWQMCSNMLTGAKGTAFMQLKESAASVDSYHFMVKWNHPFGKFASKYFERHISHTNLHVEHFGNTTAGTCQAVVWEVSLTP